MTVTVPVPPRLALRILLKLFLGDAQFCEAVPSPWAPAAAIPAWDARLPSLLQTAHSLGEGVLLRVSEKQPVATGENAPMTLMAVHEVITLTL